ncbi:DNA-directed RNA polymerase sigma-70 factor [Lactococcus hodotermopsidis]|uniref:DNA-directed RNA polymerase sigma-70 factor n=1 Tax=Pseudolactococcus hodotermopsidis TaxID=2709157 RepID=A0A6A0BIA4_9LACT|nr:sigma-70 family RNA polymerase sigma factor [Lactococcus hodotermopsidis]GFH43487.1 DNA-directed RNA polymerase sigma-70 factor [Lactococcus hodotermopsidis]
MKENFFQLDLDKVVEEYADMVYRIAFVRMKNKNEADDIFQEVFLRLVKHHERIKDATHLKAWLIRVTINCCKKQYDLAWHKKRVTMAETQFEIELGNAQEVIFLADDVNETLMTMILNLSDDHKTVLLLFYFERYSIREISRLIEQSESTVKTRLSRARKALKKKMEGEIANEG